jgi:hypothetical protein
VSMVMRLMSHFFIDIVIYARVMAEMLGLSVKYSL